MVPGGAFFVGLCPLLLVGLGVLDPLKTHTEKTKGIILRITQTVVHRWIIKIAFSRQLMD